MPGHRLFTDELLPITVDDEFSQTKAYGLPLPPDGNDSASPSQRAKQDISVTITFG